MTTDHPLPVGYWYRVGQHRYVPPLLHLSSAARVHCDMGSRGRLGAWPVPARGDCEAWPGVCHAGCVLDGAPPPAAVELAMPRSTAPVRDARRPLPPAADRPANQIGTGNDFARYKALPVRGWMSVNRRPHIALQGLRDARFMVNGALNRLVSVSHVNPVWRRLPRSATTAPIRPILKQRGPRRDMR